MPPARSSRGKVRVSRIHDTWFWLLGRSSLRSCRRYGGKARCLLGGVHRRPKAAWCCAKGKVRSGVRRLGEGSWSGCFGDSDRSNVNGSAIKASGLWRRSELLFMNDPLLGKPDPARDPGRRTPCGLVASAMDDQVRGWVGYGIPPAPIQRTNGALGRRRSRSGGPRSYGWITKRWE